MPPSLVGGQVHTCNQPVGILHISIDTSHEGRLLEVRSIGSGIDTIDERIVISVEVGKQAIEILAHATFIGF